MILSNRMTERDSQVHFTLVIHSYKSGPKLATMQRSLADIRAFFGRFQMPYEVIWLNPAKAPPQEKPDNSDDFLSLVELEERGTKTSALHRAILSARGEFIIVADENLATPLGDLFKVLQTTISEKKWAWGERNFTKLKTEKSKRLQHDELFAKIILEKNRTTASDFFCETWGFSKSSWLETFPQPPKHNLLSVALSQSIQPEAIMRVKVTDSGLTPQHYPSMKLWLSRFFFSIK